MVDVLNLAEYLGISPDEDAGNLRQYINAAKSKARAAGISDYQHNALYDQFIRDLAGHFYENRAMGANSNADPAKEQAIINGYVLPLRHAGEDPEAWDE